MSLSYTGARILCPDLFISIESLILKQDERWQTRKDKKDPARLARILEPEDGCKRSGIKSRCIIAHNQRNTVAHGVDRKLIGFDKATSSFPDLVWEVAGWARCTLLTILRLINSESSLEKALKGANSKGYPVVPNHSWPPEKVEVRFITTAGVNEGMGRVELACVGYC